MLSSIKMRKWLFLFVYFVASSGFSLELGGFHEVSASEWRLQFGINLKQEICSNRSQVLYCYQVDQKSCFRVFNDKYNTCSKMVKIPDVVDLSDDSAPFISKISSCMVKELEKLSQLEKIDSSCLIRGDNQ